MNFHEVGFSDAGPAEYAKQPLKDAGGIFVTGSGLVPEVRLNPCKPECKTCLV